MTHNEVARHSLRVDKRQAESLGEKKRDFMSRELELLENTEELEREEDEENAPLEEFDSEEKLQLMAEAADAVRATNLIALDLRELTIVTDFFLLCTGNSGVQIRAIADRIEDRLRDEGIRKLRVEGYREGTWVLMDYGDVVVHVMAEEQRQFYKLEELWKDAPQLPLKLAPADAPSRGLRDFDLIADEDNDDDDLEDEEDDDEE